MTYGSTKKARILAISRSLIFASASAFAKTIGENSNKLISEWGQWGGGSTSECLAYIIVVLYLSLPWSSPPTAMGLRYFDCVSPDADASAHTPFEN